MKLTSTVKAPACTSLLRDTVKSRPVPSVSVTSPTVSEVVSSSLIVPVAVSESSISMLDEVRFTVKVSVAASETASSKVATVNCCVSPAVPAKFNVWASLS